MSNPETRMTLDDGVAEVLSLLTGLDLQYQPELDRYQSITRSLNRAMRDVALEKEWSWYSSFQSIGTATEGEKALYLPNTLRPRSIGDDAVLLIDNTGDVEHIAEYAYFLPRDAINKYQDRKGLWCSITKQVLTFSRPFTRNEDGLEIRVPVMREPIMFRLPAQPEDPEVAREPVPDAVRNQEIDFEYPDLVIRRAAWDYAQSDPVEQPRVQTLEARYKDLMYQIIEREDRMTDSPYLNEFFVPVQSGLVHPGTPHHPHPHSDERR